MKVYVVVKYFIEREGSPSENEAVFKSLEDAQALVEKYYKDTWRNHYESAWRYKYEVEEFEVE